MTEDNKSANQCTLGCIEHDHLHCQTCDSIFVAYQRNTKKENKNCLICAEPIDYFDSIALQMARAAFGKDPEKLRFFGGYQFGLGVPKQ
jgi:hypothetical protein